MRTKLLAASLATALLAACSKSEPPIAPIRAVRTITVAAPEATAGSVEYAAEIRARTESRLGFRVAGKVVRRMANVGDTVKAGQALAQLDAQDLRLGQDAARAALVAAQANLDQAQADFKRFKELRDQGFISSAELERRDTALKAAKAQFDQSRAQAQVQGNQAGYAVLLADADGVITGVDAEPGMVVAAGAPVLRLAQHGPRDVVFSVPEDKVPALKAKDGRSPVVKVRLWGQNGLMPATIREVAAAADPVTRTFLVKADLSRAPNAADVRLGQTATVLLDGAEAESAAKLPLSALREHQGQSAVWVVDKATMTVASRPVRVSGVDGNEALVTSGIEPGQLVVTAGVHVLNAGQKVKLYGDAAVTSAPAAIPVAAK